MAVLRYSISEVMVSGSDALIPTNLSTFREDVIAGLSKPEKSLPCKYFYDERGSRLFEKITTLEEYYPTRTELAIMQTYLGEIIGCIGSDVNLIEFGSGSSIKTELLLAHADIKCYVPIDISEAELIASTRRIKAKHPELLVRPVAADYTGHVELPEDLDGSRKRSRNVVYFPGSTIGNFEPEQAEQFLIRTREMMGEGGGLLIGIDLKKDTATLERAYNDAMGVTAAFNLNLLERINRELQPDPLFTGFMHSASYNEAEGRIEMRLIASKDQSHSLGDSTVSFHAGEAIITEFSYKYSVPEFSRLAEAAGLALRGRWVDKDEYFAVLFFEPFIPSAMPSRSSSE